MIAISLTAEAYGELRAKLVALGLKDARITVADGLEMLLMDECFLTKDSESKKVDVFLAYEGKLIKEGKNGVDNLQ